MKKYIPLICLSAAFFMRCGNGENSGKNDSLKKDAVAEIDPGKPHEVRKGDADYAFKPDTAIQSLVLGNAESWTNYFKENGAMPVTIADNRIANVYFNSHKSKNQEMEVRVVKNASGELVPYEIIVQHKGDEHAPELSYKAIPSSDFNFVSGHGVYIGMPFDHVMSIYSNQAFMQWEKGDTVYLEYKPKSKDTNYFKRYKPEAYSVLYKFKDETLRRMEYSVDPKQFEN
jgi:hypothetical protein